MADDDFDIDIYGDADQDITPPLPPVQSQEDTPIKSELKATSDEVKEEQDSSTLAAGTNTIEIESATDILAEEDDSKQQIKSTDSNHSIATIPKQAPQEQGTQRNGGSDERLIEPGATTAVMITELQWWHTDDDIRGWVNQAGCEDELIDVTFSEHKVNGKSKGQAYVDFTSQQAATAAKQKIEALSEGQLYVKKPIVKYVDATYNPFKTTPKDIVSKPAGTSAAQNPGRGGHENRGNQFRGRGNFQNNANRGNSMGGKFRGNLNAGMNNRGGFQTQMAGFQPQNGMMGTGFGPFPNNMMNMRGGMNPMRGRGGMHPGMMGMPMGAMNMGMSMGMPMGMNNMMPGAGFSQMPQQFNPAFFQQQQTQQQLPNQSGGQTQSGTKRPRTE